MRDGAVATSKSITRTRTGSLWYIRYPLADGSGAITVATTRPETMLGDTAVAVNPDDERYTAMVGKKIVLPLIGREIPIIADAAVDREFGTGAVKITPGARLQRLRDGPAPQSAADLRDGYAWRG